MDIKGSIRKKNIELFEKVVDLRKAEYSYSQIKKETGLAKSTINNWLTYAGLTLSENHIHIQKRIELQDTS